MKRQLITCLSISAILAIAPHTAQAQAKVSQASWDAYCANEENQRKCEIAENYCEMSPDLNCDDIKQAFISNRSISHLMQERPAAEEEQVEATR